MWIYRGALDGSFISDDSFLVGELGRLYALNLPFVLEAFDPFGEIKYYL